MDNVTQLVDCNICDGAGIVDGWVSEDGDYGFEWCDCNPMHLVLEEAI